MCNEARSDCASGAGRAAGLRPYLTAWLLILILGSWFQTLRADPPASSLPRAGRVAVVYPELNEPYKSVFAAIIEGIADELAAPPLLIPIGSQTGPGLRERLAAEDVAACITLGRSAVEAVESAGVTLPVIRGAVLDPRVRPNGPTGPNGPNGPTGTGVETAVRGISLTPDPAILLGLLKQLAPHVNRVTVVYSDPETLPLISRAATAGQRLGIALVPIKSVDLLDAAATYRSVIPTLGGRDALWIPQDPQAVDDKVILPMLLNAAWEKNFVLFSSNADHAKRGALFSVYPDNRALGRRLARIAERHNTGSATGGGLAPLEDLLIAVNLRAAEHLGLGLTAQQIGSFDLTFPQR